MRLTFLAGANQSRGNPRTAGSPRATNTNRGDSDPEKTGLSSNKLFFPLLLAVVLIDGGGF